MDFHSLKVENAFVGGWAAEAAGALLEFQNRRFTDEEVDKVMHLQSLEFSPLGISPGQITDDTEMEIALLCGLIEGKDDEYFPMDRIADKYIQWHQSQPIDIGATVSAALFGATSTDDMLEHAERYNMKSESNGSMMRSMPIALFGLHRDDSIILMMATEDSRLTHPNPVVAESTGVYCLCLVHLLRGKSPEEVLENVRQHIHHPTVISWMTVAESMKKEDIETYDCISKAGHVKHAFVYVMYFLRFFGEYTYEEAIRIVLRNGGDTDTNAKIVGNLFGCLQDVPEYMSRPVLEFDCTANANPLLCRPNYCSVKYAREILYNYLGNALYDMP